MTGNAGFETGRTAARRKGVIKTAITGSTQCCLQWLFMFKKLGHVTRHISFLHMPVLCCNVSIRLLFSRMPSRFLPSACILQLANNCALDAESHSFHFPPSRTCAQLCPASEADGVPCWMKRKGCMPFRSVMQLFFSRGKYFV